MGRDRVFDTFEREISSRNPAEFLAGNIAPLKMYQEAVRSRKVNLQSRPISHRFIRFPIVAVARREKGTRENNFTPVVLVKMSLGIFPPYSRN